MIGTFEQTALGVMVIVIMLGMGASLTARDFRLALRRPHALRIGLVSQYGFMPLSGSLMALALGLPDDIAMGLLIVSCMPGGATSNVFTYFSRGDVALSVAMTVTSTIAGVVLIPLVLAIYSAALELALPYGNIAAMVLILLIPLAMGMILRRLNPAAGATAERLGSLLAVVFIAFILLSWVPRNLVFLRETAPATHLAAILLGCLGFAFGYVFTRALRIGDHKARSVALETGVQNAPLAIAIIALNFAPDDQQGMLAVVALYSLFIVITATLLTLVFRRTGTTAGRYARER